MLTPDYLLHISEGAEQISAQLHTDILKDIVRRIQARQGRGDDYLLTATDRWQIEALMDAGYLRDDIAQDIAKATGLQRKEIAEAFEDAGVTAMRYDDRIYEAAGISTTPLQQSPHMIRLMQRNYEATMGEWRNFTRTSADAAQTAFIDTMDQIYNRVLSGASGYTSAFAEAIDKLASDGLFITYPSGHRDTIETATLRCVRTGVSQATAQIQLSRMDELGVDLVVVSSHMGARPDHEVWQGKIYSRSGSNRKYPDFISSTGYGTGAGLCGWNCRHSFSPYFEGMDNPFLMYDTDENREAYEQSQQQRAMERAIRKTKRRQEVLQDAAETAENDDIRQELNNKLAKVKERLRMQNTAYREYCDENGLRPLPERLRIAKASRGQNRSTSSTVQTSTKQAATQTPRQRFNAYASKISATMDAADAKLFEKQIDNAGGPIQNLYIKFANGLSGIVNKKDAGVYRSASNTLEYSLNDAYRRTDRGRFSTLAHEMGHYFDYTIGEQSGLTFSEFDEVFIGTHLKHRPSMSDQFLEAARKDREILRKLQSDQNILNEFKRDNNSSGIQDAMDGFFNTQGRGILQWGHGSKYYNRKYNNYIKGRPFMESLVEQAYMKRGIIKKASQIKNEFRVYDTASEMWANIASAVTEQGYQLDYVQKYMPNTLQVFNKVIGMV